MELNCLLFPSKKKVNVNTISNRIVLIPQEEYQTHIYYSNFINPALIVKDELSQKLRNKISKTPPISIKNQIKKLAINTKKDKQNQKNKLFEQSFENFNFHIDAIKQRVPCYSQIELKSLPISDSHQTVVKKETPDTEPSTKVRGYIPCLFLPGSDKFIFYFHGNAEDIKSSSEFLKYIYRTTGKSILAIEYQGYSIYEGSPSADKIERDIPIVMNYLMRMGLSLDNVFVIGRSIGSGPALSLVSKFKVAGLMLVSPFLSIRKLVKDKYGSLAQCLIKQRFQNYEIIKNIETPTLVLHGTKDTIIPHSHSEQLCALSPNISQLILIQGMTHMSFDFRRDFMLPLEAFFGRIRF